MNLSFNKFWYKAQPQLNNNTIPTKAKNNGAKLAKKCNASETCFHIPLAALHTYKTLSGFTPLGNFTGGFDPRLKLKDTATIIIVNTDIAKSNPGFLFILCIISQNIPPLQFYH